MEEKITQKDLIIYKPNEYKYDFQQNETTRFFGESIYTGKINIDEAEMDEGNLLKKLVEFNDKSRARTTEGKDKCSEVRELIRNPFRGGLFPIKNTRKRI